MKLGYDEQLVITNICFNAKLVIQGAPVITNKNGRSRAVPYKLKAKIHVIQSGLEL